LANSAGIEGASNAVDLTRDHAEGSATPRSARSSGTASSVITSSSSDSNDSEGEDDRPVTLPATPPSKKSSVKNATPPDSEFSKHAKERGKTGGTKKVSWGTDENRKLKELVLTLGPYWSKLETEVKKKKIQLLQSRNQTAMRRHFKHLVDVWEKEHPGANKKPIWVRLFEERDDPKEVQELLEKFLAHKEGKSSKK
jgi:hypothetical protein